MRGKLVFWGLALTLLGGTARAQDKPVTPIANDIYCSGVVSKEAPPRDTEVITGEESNYKLSFQEGDFLYINKGSNQGVKAGDVYQVLRPTSDPTITPWFKWQHSILRAIGTVWEDEGRVRVVVAQPDVSIAQVESSCSYLHRGDIAVPFAERPAPPLKSEDKFDRFAPPSGKPKAMVVVGKFFKTTFGTDDVAYVNLGADQGVKVGDYFRVFRYQGTEDETAYQTRRTSFQIFGFGGVGAGYKWDKVPREVLGEGIVVRTGRDASTVLITFSLREIYSGDYVELE